MYSLTDIEIDWTIRFLWLLVGKIFCSQIDRDTDWKKIFDWMHYQKKDSLSDAFG